MVAGQEARTSVAFLVTSMALVFGVTADAGPERPKRIPYRREFFRRFSRAEDGDASLPNAVAVSSDGRFVAFEAAAAVRSGGRLRILNQVFVRDLRTARPKRVSVNSDGQWGNCVSWGSGMSADGRFFVFTSDSDNLVPGDTNGRSDVFMRDMQTEETRRLSKAEVAGDYCGDAYTSGGRCISADGRYAVFESYVNSLVYGQCRMEILLADTETGTLTVVSSDEDSSVHLGGGAPQVSANGRYIVYRSEVDDLVPGDTNGMPDVFVYDRVTGLTRRASVASDGTEGNDISGGLYQRPAVTDSGAVVFSSAASNLVEGDANGAWDTFLHDFDTGGTTLLGLGSNLEIGIYGAHVTSLSSDGRTVAFSSKIDALVPEDTNGEWDAFAYDVPTGVVQLLSRDSKGMPGNSWSSGASLSSDGAWCVFDSAATNLAGHGKDTRRFHAILLRLR